MAKEVVVSLKDGKIRGITEKSSFSGAEYYSFYGVPYGQPAVGDLRFKDPVKVQPWRGLRDAVHKKEGCSQYSFILGRIVGSEDCLYVNVYTPKVRNVFPPMRWNRLVENAPLIKFYTQLPQNGEPLKAVIAFIHLGSQLWGSPDPEQFGSPKFVMNRDIVYVTIGYRLSIFGFLNLNLPDCSGNQALKDIIMAFQWIKENIHVFNGDPTNVTAMGSSSGGDLVHILTLSPMGKGLFHKAIIMGNYLFNPLVPNHPNQIELAFDFAQQLGFKGNEPKKLLRFLKKLPTNALIINMKDFRNKHHANVCKAYEGGLFMGALDEKVLPVSPRQLFNSTQRIPTIFGISDKEAVLALLESSTICKNDLRQNVWGWMHNLDDNELEQMYEQIKSFYYKNNHDKDVPISLKIDMLSDAAFSEVYDTLIDIISADLPSSVYVYKFLYLGELGFARKRLKSYLNEQIQGTYHSEDVGYWAHISNPQTEKTKQMIEIFTKLLSNFAKTGNPNYPGFETQWKPTTPEKQCYLEIDDKINMVDGKLNGERFEFWDKLKKQFKHD